MKVANLIRTQQKHESEILAMAEVGRASLGIFHDILNPLAGLILYLDMIKSNKNFDNKTRELLQPAIMSSKKLSTFLKVIQNDLRSTEIESIQIGKIVRNVIGLLSHRARTQNVSIVFARGKIPPIDAKKMRIYQVLINVISNAIDSYESLPPGDHRKRRINIVADDTCGYVRLRVMDNGAGIGPDALRRIFDRGFSTKRRGYGIGLYSTRQIVKSEMCGDIFFETQSGKGTTCTILISKFRCTARLRLCNSARAQKRIICGGCKRIICGDCSRIIFGSCARLANELANKYDDILSLITIFIHKSNKK